MSNIGVVARVQQYDTTHTTHSQNPYASNAQNPYASNAQHTRAGAAARACRACATCYIRYMYCMLSAMQPRACVLVIAST